MRLKIVLTEPAEEWVKRSGQGEALQQALTEYVQANPTPTDGIHDVTVRHSKTRSVIAQFSFVYRVYGSDGIRLFSTIVWEAKS